MLSPILIITILVLYFSVLILIAKITQGRGSHESFFLGKRESPWYIVAYGMIGATLSGVTFLSVPGMVKEGEFFYMQMVLGYVPGY
jgi:SSS family solute:Na+ symporter